MGPDLGQLVGLADELLDVAFSEVTVTRLVGREDDLRGLVLADGRGTPTPPPPELIVYRKSLVGSVWLTQRSVIDG